MDYKSYNQWIAEQASNTEFNTEVVNLRKETDYKSSVNSSEVQTKHKLIVFFSYIFFLVFICAIFIKDDKTGFTKKHLNYILVSLIYKMAISFISGVIILLALAIISLAYSVLAAIIAAIAIGCILIPIPSLIIKIFDIINMILAIIGDEPKWFFFKKLEIFK